MITSSVFHIEPLHVCLTNFTSKGFVDHYGFMEQIKEIEIEVVICCHAVYDPKSSVQSNIIVCKIILIVIVKENTFLIVHTF
jgi:hypothetical protein